MSFFTLVRREMQLSLPRLVIMSSIAGISTAAILAAVNAGAQAASSGSVSLQSATLFVIALLLFVKTQHFIFTTTTVEIETIIHRLRVRLMDQVRHSELRPLDTIGRSEIVAAITKETATLAQAADTFGFASQSVVLVFFVSIYIAYLSLLAFVLSVAIVCLAALIFLGKNRELTLRQREALEWENRLFDRLSDLLDGFKEVRLNRARSDDLFNDIVAVSQTAADIKIRTKTETFRRLVFSQTMMYILLGAIVFIVPSFSATVGDSITKTTTALLFVIGSCWGLVQAVPILSAANAAADNIEQLEAKLRATAATALVGPAEPARRFERIEIRNIVFRYLDKSSSTMFQIGPLDFTLRRGELVFITGGNGSGKSTFMKVLAGLYEPDSGEITLDGMRIDESTRDVYRGLFSAIFSDYHLFLKLYGIRDPDSAEIGRLLTQFRLRHKTHYEDGEFRTIDLSGGQRKRLGLIVSLLEKRPILLLDEWTADQDPEFRRRFYDELLPEMTAAGLTVVVITHDDRYLNELKLPSRRLHMDEGRLVERQAVENG